MQLILLGWNSDSPDSASILLIAVSAETITRSAEQNTFIAAACPFSLLELFHLHSRGEKRPEKSPINGQEEEKLLRGLGKSQNIFFQKKETFLRRKDIPQFPKSLGKLFSILSVDGTIFFVFSPDQ